MADNSGIPSQPFDTTSVNNNRRVQAHDEPTMVILPIDKYGFVPVRQGPASHNFVVAAVKSDKEKQ